MGNRIKLTNAEKAALNHYAVENGVYWRRLLMRDWSNSEYPSISNQTVVATLQSMCNERGRRSLSSFDNDLGYAISQDESRARLAS
jgi:hypothetical protein